MTQVSIIAVRALVTALERAGVARERFLGAANLSAEKFADDGARLTLAHYQGVLRAALATSGDPALGLHMGEQVNLGGYDVLGLVTEHSSCLREALQMAVRYARIVMEGPRLELHEQADSATIRCVLLGGEAPAVWMTAEFVTSSLLFLVRRFVGGDVRARRVFFPYEAPPHRAEYTRVFAGREQFSQDFIGLEFERSWLDCSHAHRSPELGKLLQARAELLLARVEQEAPAAERVKRWLASQDLQTRPTMEAIARELGMSARSLRRRLHGERADFTELVESARADRAKDLLADPRHSVQEAAYSLGFGTPAAFSRAFKRWTGVAPSAYRAAR